MVEWSLGDDFFRQHLNFLPAGQGFLFFEMDYNLTVLFSLQQQVEHLAVFKREVITEMLQAIRLGRGRTILWWQDA